MIRIDNTQYITNVAYQYVLKGRDGDILLDIDERDIIQNADGELDCPLDTVLRKNNHSFSDLAEWNIQSIHFIERVNEEENVLRSIELNFNM
ncbi:hypothetical protein GCM10008932_15110 [Alkalibacterium iburiense]|uniref:Uncharacterized protein n=1 Tax=Alkalibacterium iburiense TaxID=290589 RepID=A0ABN0XGI8_9LACT